ncbi:MAG: branched-chain amino acid ABC transporter permease [Firmicutes bacterium HGW-Firmicutes-16]|nr:MAG: branched-chain amino acid ABC transporter permease [Firmicutes bacterium HGW-Firmicutes-16]
MNKKKKNLINVAVLIALLAIVLIFSYFLPSSSMLFVVLKKGAIYSLIAVSMNLLNGFTGLFSLGQAGFMLIGAYTYAIFTIPLAAREQVYQYFNGGIIHFTVPVIVALILAGLAAAIFAFLIGLPVLRLKSDYLAIATLGFAEIIRAIFQWNALGPVTNGSNMLKMFPSFDSIIKDLNKAPFFENLFISSPWIENFLITMLPILLSGICIAVIVMLINSSYGRAFKAIRDDEIAAEAMGINLARHKMISFCTSAFFAGIGGAMLAMFQATIQASAFKSGMTYEILLIVVLGGIGSITGSCIGSFLFIAASEWWLRGLDSGKFLGIDAPGIFRNGFRLVVFSVIIMCVVLFWRKGIMGDKEFDIERIIQWFKNVPVRFRKMIKWFKNFGKKKGEVSGNE